MASRLDNPQARRNRESAQPAGQERASAAPPMAGSSALTLVMVIGPALLLTALIGVTGEFANRAGEMLTRNTVRLALFWYFVALCLMQWLRSADWAAGSRLGQFARWCWTWGLLCFLVHLGMAFHFYDHWSHAHAFERTRQVSGIGEGIYISYLFTAVWLADVFFWWRHPARRAARPIAIDYLLHGFMLFLVFNSMVVYESGGIRWAGIAMFSVLGGLWFFSQRKRAAPVDAPGEPASSAS